MIFLTSIYLHTSVAHTTNNQHNNQHNISFSTQNNATAISLSRTAFPTYWSAGRTGSFETAFLFISVAVATTPACGEEFGASTSSSSARIKCRKNRSDLPYERSVDSSSFGVDIMFTIQEDGARKGSSDAGATRKDVPKTSEKSDCFACCSARPKWRSGSV